jgi:hypothetical protein
MTNSLLLSQKIRYTKHMQDGGDQNQNPNNNNSEGMFPANGPTSPPLPVEQPLNPDKPADSFDPTNPIPGEVHVSEPEEEDIPEEHAIHWTASESVDYQRSAKWYIIAGLITAVIIGVEIWLHQWTGAGLALVIYIALVILLRRPSRDVNYTLTSQGLYIEDKLHPFSDFRAFGVRQEDPLWTLVLVPTRRFGLSVTMFITEDQGEAIVDAFGTVLPMENVQPDIVDRITRRLKL